MNVNDNAGNSASQTKQILAWMQEGNSINPLQALGFKVTNHSGKEVWVMKYYL